MFLRVVVLYVSAVAGLLAGASVVHAVMKPDLTLPSVE